MKRKKAIKYFDREWKEMQKRLKSYLKNEVQEELHQFRIQVKKLQAFLLLYDHSRGNHKLISRFNPVKKVFKCAGELRNAYIGQVLIQGWQPGRHAKKAARNFHSHKDKHGKRIKRTYRKLITRIKHIKNYDIENFYESQFRQIEKAFVTMPSDDQLHECRKRIKILLYNDKLVHDLLPYHINTAYLDQVQETIGTWHDQQLALPTSEKDPLTHSELNDRQFQLKMAIDQLTDNFSQKSGYQ